MPVQIAFSVVPTMAMARGRARRRSVVAPDIFAAAFAKVAPLHPGEVVVVGDSPYDVEAARGCGIAAVALRSGGFADAVLSEAGAVAVYDDVAALLAGYAASPLAA